jgi:hypothetical protein
MFTRLELAEVIADENLNRVICPEFKIRVRKKLINLLLNECDIKFIERFKKRGFKLVVVTKNKYFLK